MNKKIILSTGGTGGHVFPMIAFYDYLVTKNYEVIFITDQRAKKYFNKKMQNKIKIYNINSPYNKKGFLRIFAFCKLILSTISSFFFLLKQKPKIIIGSGGYASFPVLMAAYLLGIKIVIYETNSILGRTNKFFYKFSQKLLLGFDNIKDLPMKYQHKSIYVGQLLRNSFNLKVKKINNKKKDFFTILILGGSQATQFFGSSLAEIFSEINNKTKPIKIFHQCKKEDIDQIKSSYGSFSNYELFEFKSNISEIMLQADLAITRSGSSTISEMVALNTPFVAVPLPSSLDNHQYHNAKYFEDRGCCWIVEQHQFVSEEFTKLITNIVSNDKNHLTEKKRNMELIIKHNVFYKFENEIVKYFKLCS
jgi:UDP-N-acetylglucosamine--N-acetylmuramyl-(pentapeptide) pyrophosphoryl-undecaprenol N-acetylglucosamine transferase